MARSVRTWMIGLVTVVVVGVAAWQIRAAVVAKLPAGAPQQGQAAKDPWYPIRVDEASYAVDMPTKPIEYTSDLGNGIRAHGWSLGADRYELGVWYWDLPANTDPEKYLAAIAEGYKHPRNMQQDRVVDQRPIRLDGYPGMDLQFPFTATRTALIRDYVRNNRLYHLQFISDHWEETTPIRERFVSSFRFLAPEVKKY